MVGTVVLAALVILWAHRQDQRRIRGEQARDVFHALYRGGQARD